MSPEMYLASAQLKIRKQFCFCGLDADHVKMVLDSNIIIEWG